MTGGWRLEDYREIWPLNKSEGQNRKNSVWTTSKNIEFLKSYTHMFHGFHVWNMYLYIYHKLRYFIGKIYHTFGASGIWFVNMPPVGFRLYRGEKKLNHQLVMKARPLTKIRPPPPKINSSPLKNGAWKTSFSYLGPGNFQGSYVKLRECTNNWNKETTQLATSMNLLPETASLQHFFCLKRLSFFSMRWSSCCSSPKKVVVFLVANGNPWCP